MDAMVTYKITTFAAWVKNPPDKRPGFHLTWATNFSVQAGNVGHRAKWTYRFSEDGTDRLDQTVNLSNVLCIPPP